MSGGGPPDEGDQAAGRVLAQGQRGGRKQGTRPKQGQIVHGSGLITNIGKQTN